MVLFAVDEEGTKLQTFVLGLRSIVGGLTYSNCVEDVVLAMLKQFGLPNDAVGGATSDWGANVAKALNDLVVGRLKRYWVPVCLLFFLLGCGTVSHLAKQLKQYNKHNNSA